MVGEKGVFLKGGSHKKGMVKDVPKGCLAIKVGGEGEEQQRFVVPLIYFNHPLFLKLLKEAEEEYGFDHKGAIAIPCHIDQFRYVQGMIDKDKFYHHHRSRHHHRDNSSHHAIVGCFRA